MRLQLKLILLALLCVTGAGCQSVVEFASDGTGIAPAFQAPTLEGSMFEFRPRESTTPTLLVFFAASHDRSCRAFVDAMDLAREHYPDLQIIGVHTGAPHTWNDIPAPDARIRLSLIDDRELKIVNAFEVTNVPSLILVDQGAIIARADNLTPEIRERCYRLQLTAFR